MKYTYAIMYVIGGKISGTRLLHLQVLVLAAVGVEGIIVVCGYIVPAGPGGNMV